MIVLHIIAMILIFIGLVTLLMVSSEPLLSSMYSSGLSTVLRTALWGAIFLGGCALEAFLYCRWFV